MAEQAKRILYTLPDSPPGKAVELTLTYLGLPFTVKAVDFDNGEHISEAYLKMYPQGEIPVLDDDGFIIGESVAIIQYLAEKYGHKSGKDIYQKFYPASDPEKRAVIHHRLSFHLSTYQRRVYDYMIHPMDYAYKRTDENKIKMAHALRVLEELLKRHQTSSGNVSPGLYATGENLTIADPPLIMATVPLLAMDSKILEPYPCITKWFENFKEKHADLWAVGEECLTGMIHYEKNPRDMSHLKHPIHPTTRK